MPRRHYHLHDAAPEKDMPLKWHEARWRGKPFAAHATAVLHKAM